MTDSATLWTLGSRLESRSDPLTCQCVLRTSSVLTTADGGEGGSLPGEEGALPSSLTYQTEGRTALFVDP